mmetsp:Transcript_14397/g.23686  ORF Transcript_14397/g.23686 Transcript_14397/m.23686 type:complete len:290 (+) Transcript_14397:106-975(+)
MHINRVCFPQSERLFKKQNEFCFLHSLRRGCGAGAGPGSSSIRHRPSSSRNFLSSGSSYSTDPGDDEYASPVPSNLAAAAAALVSAASAMLLLRTPSRRLACVARLATLCSTRTTRPFASDARTLASSSRTWTLLRSARWRRAASSFPDCTAADAMLYSSDTSASSAAASWSCAVKTSRVVRSASSASRSPSAHSCTAAAISGVIPLRLSAASACRACFDSAPKLAPNCPPRMAPNGPSRSPPRTAPPTAPPTLSSTLSFFFALSPNPPNAFDVSIARRPPLLARRLPQ